jgi:hypothetical protein
MQSRKRKKSGTGVQMPRDDNRRSYGCDWSQDAYQVPQVVLRKSSEQKAE